MNELAALRIDAYGVVLRLVTPADLPALRRWRNSDAVRLQMLDQHRITPAEQRRWYQQISQDHSARHWCVEVRGTRCGYANLKGGVRTASLTGQAQADSGLYLGDTPVRHGLLAVAVALCQLDAAFEQLHIDRIKTQVKAGNQSALRLNQMLGYQRQDTDTPFLTCTLTAADYRRARVPLMRFFRHA
ncbi:GNAT family N-acetyltransferase [Celerinatantimonas sp. YJH-8]|uniref:GNAT family N-acetyltransferase n=1 Tax=Celerinatantimonas sp. YJH-8 TaxID=3228714 RepID=UPI0038C4B19D